MKFQTHNYCGSNEGSYEIQNPISHNAFPNLQTLKTTFLEKNPIVNQPQQSSDKKWSTKTA